MPRAHIIAIARAAEDSAWLSEQLAALGHTPLLTPTIAFVPPDDRGPLDAALAALGTYDWLVLTSGTAARAVFGALKSPVLGVVRVACVGRGTERALLRYGVRTSVVPATALASSLPAALGELGGRRILLPQADLAGSELADALLARGALVDAVVAYRTIVGPGGGMLLGPLRAGGVDAIALSSGSTARYLLEGLTAAGVTGDEALALANGARLAAIGPSTAKVARSLGLRVDAVADEQSDAGLLAATLAVVPWRT